MKITAIIVTYNRPEALELILRSILRQRELPAEVVVADDGSGPGTARVIERCRERFPVPLKQVWHEDCGFRGAAIRNRAVAESSGDYLVFSDGDLLFHPLFFRDFRRMAREGSASVGSRVFLTREATGALLAGEGLPGSFSLLSRGIEKNRLNTIRIPLLTRLLPAQHFSERLRGGLLGVWKKELEKVNGWNEDFTGWGLEDTELVARLCNAGVHIRKLKFAAVTWHLWHPVADRRQLETNRQLLRETIAQKRSWCANGLVRSPAT